MGCYHPSMVAKRNQKHGEGRTGRSAWQRKHRSHTDTCLAGEVFSGIVKTLYHIVQYEDPRITAFSGLGCLGLSPVTEINTDWARQVSARTEFLACVLACYRWIAESNPHLLLRHGTPRNCLRRLTLILEQTCARIEAHAFLTPLSCEEIAIVRILLREAAETVTRVEPWTSRTKVERHRKEKAMTATREKNRRPDIPVSELKAGITNNVSECCPTCGRRTNTDGR